MQSGAYQNGTCVVGVAKAGDEEGVPMIGGSCIIHPVGLDPIGGGGRGLSGLTAKSTS